MRELVVLEENHGISQKSGKPYHFIKLADPATFENYMVSVCPLHVQGPLGLVRGEKVTVEVGLTKHFENTNPILTSIKRVQNK